MSEPTPQFKPSDEQRAVIETNEDRFMVVAAAGAGKTRVLVERYLRCVRDFGLEPEQILTITFTKKAAAEMKDRIVTALRNAKEFDKAQAAETGPIQTIHSLCERLLRENSLEAGLDPKFTILSNGQTGRLVVDCVREALTIDLADYPEAEALITSLAGKGRYGDKRSPYGLLESAVEQVLRELRGAGVSREEVMDLHRSPHSIRNYWKNLIFSVLDPKVRAEVHLEGSGEFVEQIKAGYKASGQRVPAWCREKALPEVEAQALLHTCGLMQLVGQAWWRLVREMDRLQALDFTELEARAVRLMQTSEVTRDRVRDQYRVLMVDEAQDVNPVQYRLLENLGIEKEMFVGDVQQSIYGFRLADVDLFRRRMLNRPVYRLSRNFRSDPGILAFVDGVFRQQWANEYRPMIEQPATLDLEETKPTACTGIELWKQAVNDSNATAKYLLEVHEEGNRWGDICVLVRDGGGARELERGLKLNDIPYRLAGGSEQYFTRLEVRDLANALRAVADPYDDFALLACLRSPVVGISLDAVAELGLHLPVVDHLDLMDDRFPEDRDKVREFRLWFDPLKKYADRLSAWEVLSELLAKSHFFAALAKRHNAAQLLANARKLLVLAAQEPELGPLEYADRIHEVQAIRHEEGDAPADAEDADVVTIMTIHKAKGLEFPIIVLPQTGKKLARLPRELIVDGRLRTAVTKFGRTPSVMYKFLADLQKTRAVEEEIRVLYVALTRAKKRLCICLFPRDQQDTVSRRINDALGSSQIYGYRERSEDSSNEESMRLPK